MSGMSPNWKLYEDRCRDSHREWLQSLSPTEGASLFQELCVLVAATHIAPEERERLEQYRWASKLEVRQRLVSGFSRRGPQSAGVPSPPLVRGLGQGPRTGGTDFEVTEPIRQTLADLAGWLTRSWA